MNKGFKVYFKEGKINSKKTLKGKGNLLRYYVFLMLSVLSVICPILLPVLSMANYRLARQVKYENNIEVCKLFNPGDNCKNYWTTILVGFLKFLFFMAMLLVVAFLIGVCFAFGYGVQLILGEYSGIIPLAFTVPGGILLLVFLIVYPFATVPAAFLVENTDGINASKALFDSVHALNKTGKRTLFATYLVQILISIVILAVGIIVPFLPVYFMMDYVGFGITIILYLLSGFILLRVLPKYDLAFAIARLSLFEDLCTDIYKASTRTNGVTIKGVESISIEDTLTALFEYEETAIKRVGDVLNETQDLKVVSTTVEKPQPKKPEPVVEQTPVTPTPVAPKVEKAPVVEPIVQKIEKTTPVVETVVPKTEEVKPVVKEPETVKSHETAPVVEPVTSVIEETSVVEETPVVEESTIEVESAAEETAIVEETATVIEEEPVVEPAVVEEPVTLIEEEPVVEEIVPTVESTPVVEETVLEETTDVEEPAEEEELVEEISEEDLVEESDESEEGELVVIPDMTQKRRTISRKKYTPTTTSKKTTTTKKKTTSTKAVK